LTYDLSDYTVESVDIRRCSEDLLKHRSGVSKRCLSKSHSPLIVIVNHCIKLSKKRTFIIGVVNVIAHLFE